MTMPFSPCDTSTGEQCKDQSITILREIFGPVIDKLTTGADPGTVDASANILSAMMSIFNQGTFIVVALIISYTMIMGVINTANDGEALGKNWSTVWTPVRIVSFSGMLMPTVSGYSYIQLVIFMVTLWGIGFANWAYRTGVSVGLLSPNAIVGSVYKSGEFYGLRNFAAAYLSTSYCARVANQVYATDSATPTVSQVVLPGTNNLGFGYADTNTTTALSGGSPFCGTVAINSYTAASSDDRATQILENLHASLQQVKSNAARQMMSDIDAWVSTWPVSMNSDQWSSIDANKFNEIVNTAENKIISAATNTDSQASSLSGVTQQYVDALTEQGWITAAGWYQRVGKVRELMSQVTSAPVGDVKPPTFVGLPMDSRTSQLIYTVSTITDKVRSVATARESQNSKIGSSQLDSISAVIPTNPANVDITALQKTIDDATSVTMGNAMHTIVDILLETNTNGQSSFCGSAGKMGGTLNRMKCVGDYLSIVHSNIYLADRTSKLVVTGVRMVASVASAGKVLGTGLDADKPAQVLYDFIFSFISPVLQSLMFYLFPVAMAFSVVLPSAPYMIFMIVVVGNFLAVLQSIIAVTLWGVMHATPERSFIGGQTQGYLLILALFIRPVLSVLGLFASFLLVDPIVNFVTTGFFGVYNAISASTGTVGWFSQFVQFMWWLIAYGSLLIPVLYMIFGLPQVLPDHVLKWINIGISDLGETGAASKFQGSNERLQSNAILRDQIMPGLKNTSDSERRIASKEHSNSGHQDGDVSMTGGQGVNPGSASNRDEMRD